ncbi:MAG: CBS domain-containing protein [Planctomycetaceae bacterium]
MNIADMMTREFEIVREETSLLDAIRHLRECPLVEDEIGIKCVVVLDANDRLAGVLTQSDVVGEVLFPYFVRDLAGQRPGRPRFLKEDFAGLARWASRVKVRDVMSRNPVTITPDADSFEAADTLLSRKVKSLPVLEGEKVVGILYRTALYRHIAESLLEAEPRAGERRAKLPLSGK